MQSLVFEKGRNGIYRILVSEHPEVFGVGQTVKEAMEDFFAKMEAWDAEDHAEFIEWFRQEKQILENMNPEDNVRLQEFQEVDRDI